jgi:hypothetical protein
MHPPGTPAVASRQPESPLVRPSTDVPAPSRRDQIDLRATPDVGGRSTSGAPGATARPGEGSTGSGGPQIAALPPSGPPAPQIDIRSALRGGVAGRGGGRGGITGDPIPLDSGDPRFSDYLELIRRAIQDKMAFPCNRNRATGRCEEPANARVIIDFGILRDGRLQFAEIVERSAEAGYDDNSVRAILLAAPFPPIPPAIMATRERGSNGLPIRCIFSYVVTTNFSTILR